MPQLMHLIYASCATRQFEPEQLLNLLRQSRCANERTGLTGMLLHSDGSFFQVLEGDPAVVDALFRKLRQDPNHSQVTLIIREQIARRSFENWSMGFSGASHEELLRVDGLNDFFFENGSCFTKLSAGRAKKLVAAFAEGSWRTKLAGPKANELPANTQAASDPNFTFAFQPIVDAKLQEVFSYEALIRGPGNEPSHRILEQVPRESLILFDQKARVEAIGLATRLGIDCHLNLNFMPQSLQSPSSIVTTLEAANRASLPIDQLVLEVTEEAVIDDPAEFAHVINKYRGLGLMLAIDDFGAGYSGLNLLADFQPDQIKLDLKLIRGIERHGPRQAIVRAIRQVCNDLGIDVIAEGVETVEEYRWLANAGVRLYQGYLFAKPAFESFPPVHYPDRPLKPLAGEGSFPHVPADPVVSLGNWPHRTTVDSTN
jgi:EAL domain-containing protein (putative c-di-GMP-specific phosphodiesterase class I)